jgi:DNA modification methylase
MTNLTNLHKEIGTAKDNRTSPIHDWYRFTAGFSYKLVDKIILEEKLNSKSVIFESFAGCGTTLVSAQKHSIPAVGNEGQELLIDIINAKLNWNVSLDNIDYHFRELFKLTNDFSKSYTYHKLLESLYTKENLFQLYAIKDYINSIDSDVRIFLKLALTQTLHKVSIHPIAIPYISRSKYLKSELNAYETFCITAQKMIIDLEKFRGIERSSSVYHHDSRLLNPSIPDNHCSICITSPPYLNNLDYGEVSKVCSHFYGITDTWNDITENVRKNLVTGATTHYKDDDFEFSKWIEQDFYVQNKHIVDRLLPDIQRIKDISYTKKGKKSFDLLALYYFEDMYRVLMEMRRVLKPHSKAFLVLGDSAPYGVYIDTTKILGEIALNIGFENYEIVKIRERGTKWTSLKHRHSLTLSENILILR